MVISAIQGPHALITAVVQCYLPLGLPMLLARTARAHGAAAGRLSCGRRVMIDYGSAAIGGNAGIAQGRLAVRTGAGIWNGGCASLDDVTARGFQQSLRVAVAVLSGTDHSRVGSPCAWARPA